MTKTMLTLVMLFISYHAHAQYHITYRYLQNNYDRWETRTAKTFPVSHELSVGYYAKLKNYRVEFFPELAFSLSANATVTESKLRDKTLAQSYIGFAIPVYLYPFNINDDCDCPTFSKQGPKFMNSISIMIRPSVRYNIRSASDIKSKNNITIGLGFGVGYDIGINDLVTVTPQLGLRYNFGDLWYSDEFSTTEPLLPKDEYLSPFVGLRTLLRFDYVRKNRW